MRQRTRTALCAAGVSGVAAGAAIAGGAVAIAAVGMGLNALLRKPLPAGAVIVITGGSRGLGYALAARFARTPVKLVLAARNREELERAQASLLAEHGHLRPEDFHLYVGDLAERGACEGLVDAAFSRFGRIDVLVNNAGIIQVGPAEEQSVETFEYAISIMYMAGMYITMAALPRMLRQQPLAGWSRRAAVVNISSIGGKVAVPHLLPYCAAKFAMVGFSEGLHAELKHKGIHVMTVCPGLMRTGGEDHAHFVGQVEKEEAWFKFSAKTPGVSCSVEHAARKIVSSLEGGRAEITITPQAWLAARMAGVCPETTQCIAGLANRWVLPAPLNEATENRSAPDALWGKG